MPKAPWTWRLWLLALLGWFSAAYFHHPEPGWNASSRLALTYAIVEEGRLTIDSFHRRPGYETGDKAEFNGHFYSDKIIGSALAAVPVYWVMHRTAWLFGMELTPNTKRYICRVFTVALAFGLLLALMAQTMMLHGLDERDAILIAMLGGLGTMLYPHATVFYPYAPACLFSLLAYRLLLPDRLEGRPSSLKTIAWAGACAGLAVLFEYLAVVIAICLGALALWNQRGVRAVLKSAITFAASASVSLVPYLVYLLIIFGELSIPHQHLAHGQYSEGMRRGLLGIGFPPDPQIVGILLFHPFRGLFLYSPILFIGLLGALTLLRTRREAPLGAMWVLGFMGLLLINGGFFGWWAGWSWGPRYLTPSLPFLILGVAVTWQRWPSLRPLVLYLAILSVLMNFIPAAVDPQPPVSEPPPEPLLSPYRTFYFPRLARQEIGWNAGQLLGLPGLLSLWPLLGVLGIGMCALLCPGPERVGSRPAHSSDPTPDGWRR